MLMSVVTLVGFVWIMYEFAIKAESRRSEPGARRARARRRQAAAGGRQHRANRSGGGALASQASARRRPYALAGGRNR